MKVELLDYQKNALEILIHTKSTRLAAHQTIADIEAWPMERKLEHLDYMRHTIQSSWEFVRYIFSISEVSRVFTHQLVRTRSQSYAQESQRTIDASKNNYFWLANADYIDACEFSFSAYNHMQKIGMSNQDARYVLPEGTLTSVIVGTDLRTLSNTAETRLCTRTQGEYQDVFRAMRQAVIDVHPWAEPFIEVACVKTGICAFPNYKECPIQEYTIKIEDSRKRLIKEWWEHTRHEAVPIAKDGKTM